MNNLSQTTRAFLKWRKCKTEEEEVYDMFLQENIKGISDIDKKQIREGMIKIYEHKCQKLYNKYLKLTKF
jgi:predicted Ser/Thr protein kinase